MKIYKIETEDEAIQMDKDMGNMLREKGITCRAIKCDDKAARRVSDIVLDILEII